MPQVILTKSTDMSPAATVIDVQSLFRNVEGASLHGLDGHSVMDDAVSCLDSALASDDHSLVVAAHQIKPGQASNDSSIRRHGRHPGSNEGRTLYINIALSSTTKGTAVSKRRFSIFEAVRGIWSPVNTSWYLAGCRLLDRQRAADAGNTLPCTEYAS